MLLGPKALHVGIIGVERSFGPGRRRLDSLLQGLAQQHRAAQPLGLWYSSRSGKSIQIGAAPEVFRHPPVVLRGAVADIGGEIGRDRGAVQGRRPDELVALLEIRPAFVPQELKGPCEIVTAQGKLGSTRYS